MFILINQNLLFLKVLWNFKEVRIHFRGCWIVLIESFKVLFTVQLSRFFVVVLQQLWYLITSLSCCQVLFYFIFSHLFDAVLSFSRQLVYIIISFIVCQELFQLFLKCFSVGHNSIYSIWSISFKLYPPFPAGEDYSITIYSFCQQLFSTFFIIFLFPFSFTVKMIYHLYYLFFNKTNRYSGTNYFHPLYLCMYIVLTLLFPLA